MHSALHLALSYIFIAHLASDEVMCFLPMPPALSPFCPRLQVTRAVVSSCLTSDKAARFIPPSLALVHLQVMRAVVSSHLTSDEEARFVPPLPRPHSSASDKAHFVPPPPSPLSASDEGECFLPSRKWRGDSAAAPLPRPRLQVTRASVPSHLHPPHLCPLSCK
ncbi:hypothetical protein BDQ17DRAFT_1431919 [Cyathus striatus]|nr:hypothetical protein BDQ17DRAFT_1431919 [Cyathus striatus]